MEDVENEITIGKKVVYWIIGIFIVISLISFIIHKTSEATHIDDAVQNYEEFQSVYNTCLRINTDLCTISSLPDNDKMFEQFSKTQMIYTKKTQLNRWVEEYNAKSNMWGRSLWKSSKLPYQLSVEQFSCNK